MGQANSPADPSTLVPLSVTDPAFSYLQQLSIFQQPERNQELLTRMAQILGTQQPQPDPVSRIPMANMILPLMGGGMQMGSTAEAPPLSPEQSKMGVAQSAQFQPVADVAGLMAGSMRQPSGQAVLANERGAIGGGKPPIAYHGTSAQFEQFGEEGPHFLTSSKEEAARYAGKGGRVVPAEVQMKKPYVVGKDKVLDQMFDDLGGTDAGAHYDPAFQKAIRDRGYDGMISEYGVPGDWNTYYMVLKGSQIKPVK